MQIIRLLAPAFTGLIVIGCLISFTAVAQTVEPGEFLGAKQTTHPDWFKESFLEFEEDIAEAAEQGKRLIVYFHQDGCPYCNKLVEENFADPALSEKVQSHFDLVAINMWGDREVIQVGGRTFTEKTLAEALDVNFTPTLLFFNENRKVALRLNGYYPSVEFDHALDYVSKKMEAEKTFPEHMASVRQQKKSGALNHQHWIINDTNDLTTLTNNKPLAILFEEPDCENCDLLHQRTFTNPDAEPLLEAFNIVQLNRWSDDIVTTPEGENISSADWAKKLGLGFSPAIVLFDADGEKVMVVDAMFKTFHILGVLDYVATKAYEAEPNFQRFLSERAEHIRSTGKDVNIWH